MFGFLFKKKSEDKSVDPMMGQEINSNVPEAAPAAPIAEEAVTESPVVEEGETSETDDTKEVA